MRRSFSLKEFMNLTMGLEDVQGETVNSVEREVEHVWFGKINLDELEELAKAPYVTKHLQEQSQAVLEPDPKMPGVRTVLRVRRVNREGAVLTRKTHIPDRVGVIEESMEISNEVFDFLSKVFGVCIMKMRYDIQPDAYPKKLQLDVFYDKTGHPILEGGHGIAKYDYEVTSQEDAVPDLPVALIDQQYLNPFEAAQNMETVLLLRNFMGRTSFKM